MDNTSPLILKSTERIARFERDLPPWQYAAMLAAVSYNAWELPVIFCLACPCETFSRKPDNPTPVHYLFADDTWPSHSPDQEITYPL